MNYYNVFIVLLHYTGVVVGLKLVFEYLPDCILYEFHSFTDIFSFLAIAAVLFPLTRFKILGDKIKSKGAVLITGCDSGFGHLLAKRLDSKDYQVFAGCLFPEGDGAKKLKQICSSKLQVIGMDVTKDEDVAKAAELVQNNIGSNKFLGILNNAGIQKGFLVEYASLDDFQDCINVNAFGAIRVIKQFLPLLKQHKGRIVNVASVAGRISFPFFTPYTVSKYAVVSVSECLRLEVEKYGIEVITIEPEIFKTALTDTDRIEKDLCDSTHIADEYEKKQFITKLLDFMKLASPDLHLVVDDMESALTDKYPYNVYRPRRSWLIKGLSMLLEVLPTGLVNFTLRLYMHNRVSRKIAHVVIDYLSKI